MPEKSLFFLQKDMMQITEVFGDKKIFIKKNIGEETWVVIAVLHMVSDHTMFAGTKKECQDYLDEIVQVLRLRGEIIIPTSLQKKYYPIHEIFPFLSLQKNKQKV